MGSGILWKIIVTQHSSPLNQEMQLEVVLCKEEGLINFRKNTERPYKRVLWSEESIFLLDFGKNGQRILCTKDEKDNPDFYEQEVQKTAWWWWCISAYGMGDLHACEGTIDTEAYVEILERQMPPSRRRLFPGTPCLFQQDNARPHSAQVTAWLCRNWGVCLTGLPSSPDLSPIENVWRIMKRRIRQRRPRTVEQLKSCIHQEWAKIPLAKLQLIT